MTTTRNRAFPLTTRFRASFAPAALSLGCALALSGCGDLLNPLTAENTGGETVFALDGVKLISANISQADAPSSYEQRNYSISESSRLLLRFESLNGSRSRIQANKPIRIRVFTSNETEKTKALTSLRACPITKDWMMLATWNTGHPWRDGGWDPGGAIEAEDCVSAESSATDSAFASCLETGAVCFDVKAWFNNYVLQKNMNYGIALISANGQAVQIYGDASGSHAPRIHWTE